MAQFWHYACKTFNLDDRLTTIRDRRCDPEIPPSAVSSTLFLGALLRVPSFLQLQSETQRKGWQKLVGYPGPISDDVLA